MCVTQQPNAPKRKYDASVEGLYQTPNGMYYLRYWSPKLGREIERSLGSTIKAKALKKRKQILEGIAEEPDRHAIGYKTFKPIVNQYVSSRHWNAENTKIAAMVQINRHILPWFGNYDPSRINNELWVKYALERRAEDPNCSLANAHKYLSAIVNWAHGRGVLKKKPKFESFEGDRESVGRVVSREEFTKVWELLTPDYKDISMIAWEMGMRINEIKKLSWDRVDFKTGEITLRKIDTKNRKARKPVMTELVQEILERRAGNKSKWVFASRDNPAHHYSNSDYVWQHAKDRAQVDFRFHDLRHTWLTNAFKKSNRYAEICEYAGLDLSEATKTYVDFSVDDMRAISQIFSGKVGENPNDGL